MNRVAGNLLAVAALVAAFAAPMAAAQSSLALSARAPGAPPAVQIARAAGPSPVAAAFINEGWAARTAMPAGRWAHAMASYATGTYPDNEAYVYVIAGGDASFANTGLLSRYDVGAGQWTDLAPLAPARIQIGAARIGGKIYVPGGYQGSFSPVTTLSVYDIASNIWSLRTPMPQATGDYAIAVYADRYLYVVGGYSGSADLNNVQVYDSVQNTWATGTAKPGPAVAGLRGAIVGNRILVVGGYSQTLSATQSDAYIGTINPADPTQISWAAAPSYPGGPAGRLGGGTLVAAGPGVGTAALNVALFTGGDPDGQGLQVKADTWMYDFNDDTWKDGPAKPTGVSNISNLAGVAFDGKLHLVSTGGYNGSAVMTVNEWLTLGDEVSPDLALTVSGDPTAVAPGGDIAYALDYTSSGEGTTPEVTLTETVPEGTVFDAAASTAGWTCLPDANPGSVCEFELGTLAGGASGSVTFAVQSIYPVPAGVTQIVNTAGIATAWADPEPANDGATETTAFAAGSVSFTPSDTLTSEFGDTAVIEIVLQVPPTAQVTIDLASSDLTEGALSASQLVFTPADWDQPQTVTVTGVDDALADGDVAYSIDSSIAAGSGNYDGLVLPALALTNLDELDLALTVSDAGATIDPGAGIVYTLGYAVTGAGAAQATNVTVTDTVPAGASFDAAASTPGWVCVPDASAGSVCSFTLGTLSAGASGDLDFAVTSVYPVPAGVTQLVNTASIATDWTDALPTNDGGNDATPFTAGSVAVTALDSESSEAGDSASFRLTLQVAPSADVAIDVASDDASEGAAAVSQVIFTPANWNVPQTVVVNGVDDALEDGDVAYAVVSTVAAGSGNYTGVPVAEFDAANADDETAGAPTVTGLGSVRDTGDGLLADDESTATPITQVTVGFSETLAAASADPVHFRLVRSGADDVVETSGCAGALQGDDAGVTLAGVVLATTPSPYAAVSVAGARALPIGHYRFTACDTLTDVSGNPVTAALARDFRVTASNLLDNPNFDATLAGWTLPVPLETAWDAADGDAAPTSGSARIHTQDGAFSVYDLTQCLESAAFVAAAAAARIDSALPDAPAARIRVDYFSGPGCTGALVDSVVSAPAEGDSGGQWVTLEVLAPQPLPPAQSARIGLEVSGHTAPASFTVAFDHAEARQLPEIFADGFESQAPNP